MGDDGRITDKAEQLVGERGEQRFVREERRGKAVHGLGFGRHVALGVRIKMELAARRHVIEQLDAADLHHAVTAQRIKARGFGIKNDFAHR